MSNRSLIQKADLSISDMMTDGGYMQPAQSKEFLKITIKQAKLMPLCTNIPMKSHTHEIDKIRFTSRIMRKGACGVALSEADRAKPDTYKVELVAKEFKSEVRLKKCVLEDNIEGDRLQVKVKEMMSEAWARDMDEIAIMSDTANAAYPEELRQFDGIIKQAVSHPVDNLSSAPGRTTFKKMVKDMPSEYKGDKSKLRFLISTDTETEYRDALITEFLASTGQTLLESDQVPKASGIAFETIPLFPDNLGAGVDESVAFLLDPKNIHFGIWRQIELETDKDITAGVLIVVMTIRWTVKFAHEDAVVKAINIKVN